MKKSELRKALDRTERIAALESDYRIMREEVRVHDEHIWAIFDRLDALEAEREPDTDPVERARNRLVSMFGDSIEAQLLINELARLYVQDVDKVDYQRMNDLHRALIEISRRKRAVNDQTD